MDYLKYSHYFSLPTQGNIYSMANLELANGTSKLLVASLKREIFCFEYIDGPKDQLIPTAREVSFTYIPTGAEIISIDAYNKSSNNNEFVVGITIIKNSNDSDALETYLNIYSGWEASDDFNIENIAQNCQNVELNFIPYRLIHTDYIQWNDEDVILKEKVFLLSGSDNLIHVFREGLDHLFKEMEAKEYFPELMKTPSPVVWMDLLYVNNKSERLFVTGCECGYLRLVKVCTKTKKIMFNFSTRLDNYISNVKLYTCGNDVNMIVISSVLSPIVFNNVMKYGLSNYISLPRNSSTTLLTCCDVIDIDLDGQLEILVGSSAKEIILYKQYDDHKWILDDVKKVSSPIFGIKHVDITGDAVKEMIVFSMKGVHIFQQDPDYVQMILNEKITELRRKDVARIKDMM
ncbi:KICSTOR complex protein kaptin-like [Harmonia axyridis]|uniref:KICSTOR complex protein kaptin-like n=1 Tax=Harmonia axyridis TaxID=115357 RepID=UPI001E279A2A|nr:KICSTOR complex protein kaptin-like [Harmonia axyridis]XP_045474507.1 KICSTOR complex protein kaptin-like [Harmonia axyridis]